MTTESSSASLRAQARADLERSGQVLDKGLKGKAIGMVESVGVGVASTAPAYSMAATLGFVVAIVGVQMPSLVILGFIPMFAVAWACKLMNKVDPDCGTSFTWAARAIGPRIGWFAGGWGTIASDFLAMGSYAQVAGQYCFLLVGANSIGNDPTSPWVLLIGILWIVSLTYVCYRGIELSAHIQLGLVAIELVMLLVLAIVALVKVASGSAPVGHLSPSLSWFDPLKISSFGAFMQGMLLMVFIYWGWDTTTSINEETEDPSRIPGVAGVISTFLLLGTYLLVVISVQSFAGVGSSGVGLGNTNHQGDVLSVMGSAVFGHSAFGQVLSRLLILMVLTSAAATTQTTILPNARTMLSMAYHKAIQAWFGRVHPRYMSPTTSTLSFGALSVVYYVALNFIAGGNVIADAVTATTMFAALYLGISGLSAVFHYRRSLTLGFRRAISNVVTPLVAVLILYFLLFWNVKLSFGVNYSYVDVNLFGLQIGGVLLVAGIATVVGLGWMIVCQFQFPDFFAGKMEEVALTDDQVDRGLVPDIEGGDRA